MHILARVISNIFALWAASWLVPGFDVLGGYQELILAGLVLAVLNMVVKPILKFISFPIIILTLGLFTAVINAALLWSLTYVFDFVIIQGLTALLLATFVVSIVNVIFSHHD